MNYQKSIIKMRLSLTVCLLIVSFQVTQAQPIKQNERWIGHFELLGEKYFTMLNMDENGQLSIRTPHDQSPVEIVSSSIGSKLLMEVQQKGRKFIFEIKENDKNSISGNVTSEGVSGFFNFYKRESRLNNEQQQPYLGYYKTKDGIFKIWNRYNTFRIYSYITQTISPLYAISDDKLYTTEGEIISFDDSKNILSWNYPFQKTKTAERFTPYSIEEVVVESDKLKLACSLYMPSNKERVPGVVMLPGGGTLDRENYRLESELFAANEIASIVCDKRGTGTSEGNAVNATFGELTADALAQFQFLKEVEQIEPNKIGFRGPSQGGRIAIMAGAVIKEEAFVIATSAPIMSMKEGQVFANLEHARSARVPETIATEAASIWSKYYDEFYAGEISQELVKRIGALRAEYSSLHLPPASTQLPAGIEADNIHDDASTYLSDVSSPILFQFGTDDIRVSHQYSLVKINEAAERTPFDFEVYLYRGANHSLMLPGFKIAPGIFMDQIEWIKAINL